MAFTYNKTVKVFCATALDGPTWMGRSLVEMPSATVQPTQRSTEGIGNYYTAKKGSVILPASSDIELHVFCDASTTAYAAVVYIRQSFDGSFHTRMLTAKTRVAPIRSLCVPRLELCAALLGANLVEAVSSSLSDQRFPTTKVYARTDSTITLAWPRDFPGKWKTFVANRVAKIQNIIPSRNWDFVPTEENPFDCASRGISAANLAKHSLWWTGPHWLEKKRRLLAEGGIN